MHSAAAQYIRRVKHQLPCPWPVREPFLNQLREEIACFLEDHPDAGIEMLIRRFGLPEEVAEEFLSEFGEQTLRRCARGQKRLLGISLGCLVAAVLLAAVIGAKTNFLYRLLPDGALVASIVYDGNSPNAGDTIWVHDGKQP